mgnify:CR=1 FL=1
MNINCDNCGHKISLDNSLKKLIMNDERVVIKEEMQNIHKEQMEYQKREFDEQLEAKTLLINSSYESKIIAIESERASIKNSELKVIKENMKLEDALKESDIKAEKRARKLLIKKEEELIAKNKLYKNSIKTELENSLLEEKKILRIETEGEVREKDLEIARLRKEAKDARSKLDHVKNSQELVGEAAELMLLERLQKSFPNHEFFEIKKGQQGADIMQEVKSISGEVVGLIYYESKKTKNWSEPWIAKFKEDIRKRGAQMGILVSEILPPYCESDFIHKDGIWITTPRYAHQLAVLLCDQLLAVYKAKLIKDGKSSLEGDVYDYVTGEEFIEKIKVVAEAHKSLSENLQKEKIAMQKIWSIRQKEIDRSIGNVAQVIGDLEALSAGNIKTIEDFQLKIK